MKAFISYSSVDLEFVRRLAQELKTRKIDVWLDEWEIKVGDEIRQKIEHGIVSYEYFIIVLSKHSVGSTWVDKELNAAFMKEVNTKKIVILPIKIEDCDIPPLISGKKYADFTASFDSGLKELLKVLSPVELIIPKKTSTNVLIVHDDLTAAHAIADFLTHTGLSATVTYDIAPAFELARRYQPDVILLDTWYARQYEGALRIESFRYICPGAKIIGMSGVDIDCGLDCFDDILTKPISADQILKAFNIKP